MAFNKFLWLIKIMRIIQDLKLMKLFYHWGVKLKCLYYKMYLFIEISKLK